MIIIETIELIKGNVRVRMKVLYKIAKKQKQVTLLEKVSVGGEIIVFCRVAISMRPIDK